MNPQVFLSLLLLLCWTLPLIAGDPDRKKPPLEKTTTNDHYQPFLINNVFNYYSNNGAGSYNTFTGNQTFEFPKGSEKCVTFEDGIVWGGYHRRTRYPGPKAGGSMYRHALQAGKIISYGPTDTSSSATAVADDPALQKYRVYRVRPDVGPSMAFTPQLETQLQTEEVALTGRYESVTARGIYDQYVKDWNEWPAAEGAPFQDVNGNGTYEPSADIPGIPGADQTLWYVASDLNATRVMNFCGSVPIGIEMQKTIWGYRRPGAIGNTIFIRARLINKSGSPVDSMYVGQWADADVGDAGNDFVGCDTTLSLGYTYNGSTWDATYGFSVPAVGFVLLTGPQVLGNASDSAIVDLRFRRGVRSLRPSSFAVHSGGSPIYSDPIQGAGGDAQLYCLLRGRIATSCNPFIDPTTGLPTTFVASGDPVEGTGWVDGMPFMSPNDRRMLLSAGSFTFAPGDTQEIVLAHMAAQGADRLSSVLYLKDGARQVIDEYQTLLRPRPSLDVSVRYPSASTAQLSVRLDGKRVRAKSATAIVTNKNGVVLQEAGLFDDGLHADSSAGDYIFAGTAQMPVVHDPVMLDIRATDGSGISTVFKSLARDVTLAGELKLGDPIIVSENFYPDRKLSPDENVRFGVSLTNQTIFPLSGLRMVLPVSTPGNLLPLASLDAGATWQSVYEPGNPGSYMTLDAPAAFEDTRYPVSAILTDMAGNRWRDTLWFPASPSRYYPVGSTAAHTAGWAHGRPGVIVIDRRSVQDHPYLIRAFSPDSAGKPITITLEDSTDGRVLLNRHELPDSLGHNMPLIDGFKLIRGDMTLSVGRMRDYDLPGAYVRFWTWLGSDGLRLEGFAGTIGNAFEHWPSGGVPLERQRSVLIRYAATDTSGKILNPASPNVSLAYRFLQNADKPAARPSFSPFITNPGPGYAYQDYSTMVPFTAFDQDTLPLRRLMVGYLENNVPAGSVDGRYWPPLENSPYLDNTSSDGPREWFFIFDLPYGTTPDPALQVAISSHWTPLMWFGTPGRRMSAGQNNLEFVIVTWLPPRTGDVWSFNPVTILGGPEQTIPSAFEVFQNYPNPFNAGTTLKYALPFDAHVTFRIYNILGQQVRLLADGNELEGYRTLRWDGKNDHGVAVGSGIYLYRLQAVSTGDSPHTFTRAGKMAMVR